MNKELERLELVADKYFISLINVTKLLGKNPATFANYKERKHIGNKLIDELKSLLGINPMYIRFNQGDMLLHKDNIIREKNLDTPAYRLELLMRKYNWKLKDIADIVGVSHQAVSNWKNGRDIPDYALDKLKENGVDTDWLLNGSEVKEQKTHTNDDDVKAITMCLYGKELRAMTLDEVEELKDRIKVVYDVFYNFISATETLHGNQLTGKRDIAESDTISVPLAPNLK